jgi:hypothetical protein
MGASEALTAPMMLRRDAERHPDRVNRDISDLLAARARIAKTIEALSLA